MTSLNDYMPISPDHNAERLAELKRLFPDLFTNEGRLDADELKRLVEPSELDNEKFRFTWYGKARAKRKAFAPSKGALVYDEARSVNPDKANGNMIIEGENLEVLKLLTSAYMGSVKCIYIDPPYNTGKDFIYPDNYQQGKREYWEQEGTLQEGVQMDTNSESSGRYHSDWLSMMYSRLLVARLLLRKDGVIFVSIDDHELHHLRKLMDEVFGEESLIASVVWKKRGGPPNDKAVGYVHEYILVYAKNVETVELYLRPRTEKQLKRYKNPDDHPKGKWASDNLMANVKGGRYVASLYYPIVNPNTGEEHYPSSNGNWRFNKDDMAELLKNNEIYFGKDGRGRPKLKRFLSDVRDGVSTGTIWDDTPFNNQGSREIEEILGNINIFDTPKPSGLIMSILQLSTSGETDEGDVCLDFFSGSATLAQAVLELNEEDGGNRRFILVQIPETIEPKKTAHKAGYRRISDITIERTKRVIEGYGDDPQPLNAGFKVYRLAQSRFPRVAFQPDPDQSEAENIAALQRYISEKEQSFHIAFDREAVFDEVLLKQGFKLTYTLEQVAAFSANEVFLVRDGQREALICLDLELADGTVDYFKTHRERIFICLERALDTTKKWNLKHLLGERLKTI